MTPKHYILLALAITSNPKFRELAKIGGHKLYHLEGDAYTHTMLVFKEACEMFSEDRVMKIAALVHDVGKIYTSVKHGPNDWTYPNHSIAGAEHLSEFIPEEDPHFAEIQWYVRNHIKPLFWRGKNLREELKHLYNQGIPKGCDVVKLAGLAVCDIFGSKSLEPQEELLIFLYEFIRQRSTIIEFAKDKEKAIDLINQGYSPDEIMDFLYMS